MFDFMKQAGSRRRLRRRFAAAFGVVGAVIMTIDSLGHIARGFVGLSLMFIVAGAAASAIGGLLVGLLVEWLNERKRSRRA